MALNRNNIVDYIVKKGSIDQNIFDNFIRKIDKDRNKYAILMDNARIHHSKKCKQTYEENNIDIIFNIPYNSDTNPIEYLINKIKAHYKRTISNNIDDMNKNLEESIKLISRNDCTQCIRYKRKSKIFFYILS